MVPPIFLPHLAYVEIDSLMFLPTLIISLAFRVRRNYRALLVSLLLVSPLYISWDFVATAMDSWGFNRAWILDVYVLDLPLEEILFFFVTPFATLLIYDFLNQVRKDSEVKWLNSKMFYVLSIILVISAFLFYQYSYTSVVLLYLASSFILAEVLDRDMLSSSNYWIFIGLSFIPFLVFDYFLTSIPVVVYGPHSILGMRILTIPPEDALYSLSMMNFYTLVYRRAGATWIART